MGGQNDPWALPSTPAQLESLCAETAAITTSWGWSGNDMTVERVMTNAEAASNKDGPVIHDNYWPVVWGGTGERWDLLQLEKNGPLDGGEQLRRRIRELIEGGTSQTPSPSTDRFSFKSNTAIEARGEALDVAIDHKGRLWALPSERLEHYAIPKPWDANQRRLLSVPRPGAHQSEQQHANVGCWSC